MRAHFTTSDYRAIVNKIYGEISDESAESVIEFENGDCLLVVQVNHRIGYKDEIGGSYEGYDFEMLAVVDEEEFDVLSADCYDSEGNEVDSDFDANELYKLLN
ncbi:hypothetical protein GHJ49_04345 [Alistipes sp. dk3620]|uniref:hypothetical protein n=1 Tax=unclassified Alistipes TaxID=2608932 RepID=UPI001295E7C3|nr:MULTISPECIES: hypothetical protein [unclassified Alistipes]MQX26878.1 hypothetical protein [Alistipes sp. dk3620]QGA24267.1 hypothetical protein GFH31_10715 [Alistipes sp. dk3624]